MIFSYTHILHVRRRRRIKETLNFYIKIILMTNSTHTIKKYNNNNNKLKTKEILIKNYV